MKIAIICPDASSNSLVRAYPIAKVLSRKHEVKLVGFRSAADIFLPYRDEFDFDTVQAHSNPRFLRQIWTESGRLEADLLYAFKPLPTSFWLGLAARRRLRVPLLLDIEDWEVGWYKDRRPLDRLRHLVHVERPNGYLWTWVAERMVKRADGILVVSRFLRERFGGQILVHGSDTAVFSPLTKSRSEILSGLGLSDHRYFVFTGSPMRNKGVEDLLRALRRLGRPDTRLLIVGSFRHDPEFATQLKEEYGDITICIGPRPHSEMPLFLSIADAVVLPQRVGRETIAQVPGKVFEAMAMARPIVATEVGDLPEILKGCGILVPPSDGPALANALQSVLDDPAMAKQLGEAARKRCVELYSWDAMEVVLDGVLGALTAKRLGH